MAIQVTGIVAESLCA